MNYKDYLSNELNKSGINLRKIVSSLDNEIFEYNWNRVGFVASNGITDIWFESYYNKDGIVCKISNVFGADKGCDERYLSNMCYSIDENEFNFNELCEFSFKSFAKKIVDMLKK
jgi:hypothetical protein